MGETRHVAQMADRRGA